jgi:hypothetical protein
MGKEVVHFYKQLDQEILHHWNDIAPKKNYEDCFRNPLCPIPNLITLTPSPAAREPIAVAIPFDLLRKRRVLMQVNVSNVRKKWTGC